MAWQFESKSVLRAGFGIFSDILPGSIADTVGFNPPYVKSFQGGLLGTVGGTAIALGVPNSAVDATVAANQTFSSGFTQGQLSCASAQANPATCLPAVAITAVPDGELHAPYFMEWSLGGMIADESIDGQARSKEESHEKQTRGEDPLNL